MKVEDMKFSDLVDWAAGEVLKGLIAGNFHSSIHKVLNTALLWKENQS